MVATKIVQRCFSCFVFSSFQAEEFTDRLLKLEHVLGKRRMLNWSVDIFTPISHSSLQRKHHGSLYGMPLLSQWLKSCLINPLDPADQIRKTELLNDVCAYGYIYVCNHAEPAQTKQLQSPFLLLCQDILSKLLYTTELQGPT